MEAMKMFAMVLKRLVLPKDIRNLIIGKCIVKKKVVDADGFKTQWWELLGVKNGLCKGWRENGQPHYEHMYKDGKLNGLCKIWHVNGQLCYEDMYKDGKKNGLCKGWYTNGILLYEAMYKDGKKVI